LAIITWWKIMVVTYAILEVMNPKNFIHNLVVVDDTYRSLRISRVFRNRFAGFRKEQRKILDHLHWHIILRS